MALERVVAVYCKQGMTRGFWKKRLPYLLQAQGQNNTRGAVGALKQVVFQFNRVKASYALAELQMVPNSATTGFLPVNGVR